MAALPHESEGASLAYGSGSDTETATHKINLSPFAVLSALAVSLYTEQLIIVLYLQAEVCHILHDRVEGFSQLPFVTPHQNQIIGISDKMLHAEGLLDEVV